MTPPGTQSPHEAYGAALEDGRLTFQRCADCGHAWLPARTECPECWSPDHSREDAGGMATVVSWVVFHVAFDPRFKDRTPYNVALVDLDEGPRLITNIIEIPAGEDIVGKRVALCFEEDMGRRLPRFRLPDDTAPPSGQGFGP
jgi:uncharacterized OB-fold protein